MKNQKVRSITSMNKLRAFTLIELLIVVAIIAILAAIAVPNMMEAQTRAKVSRIKSDQRTVTTALETYHIDQSHYPPEDAPFQPYRVPNCITTPIAYMTSIPTDIFRKPESEDPAIDAGVWTRFVYRNYNQEIGTSCGTTSHDEAKWNFGLWSLSSVGPDLTYSGELLYDPTNGTISKGDIIRSAKHPDQKQIER